MPVRLQRLLPPLYYSRQRGSKRISDQHFKGAWSETQADLNLTFMGPCIIRIFKYMFNKMQRYTGYFIWKLLYMFRVVPPPIIRSANNCIYSIWYLSHHYYYLPLSWKSWNCSSNSSMTVAGSSNGVTNTRRCRYSCLRS